MVMSGGWPDEKVPVYQCSFEFHGNLYYVTAYPICELQNGFWINNQMEFTKGNDGKWWIPPSQIRLIAKI